MDSDSKKAKTKQEVQKTEPSSEALEIKSIQKKKEIHPINKNINSPENKSLFVDTNNAQGIVIDSVKKLQKSELQQSDKKHAIQKYNRIVKIVNDTDFKDLDSEKKFLAAILDSLDDINIHSPGSYVKRSNGIYLSRAYLISKYKTSQDLNANLDSINQYLEKLYLRVLERDYYNINANYNIALLYYNQAVRILKRDLSETLLDSYVTVNELEVKELMKKSLPYFLKASKGNSFSKETLTALSGIYFALGKDKAIVDNILDSAKDDSFKSIENEKAILVNYEDSILKVKSFSDIEKKEIIINYYVSRAETISKFAKSGRFVFKNYSHYEELIEELNNKVLKIDTLNTLACKNLYDLYFDRFTNLMGRYKDSSCKGSEKAEIRNQLVVTEFEKVIPSFQKYCKLTGAADTLYFKSENGFLSILNAEEKVELKRKLGPKMVIVKADK